MQIEKNRERNKTFAFHVSEEEKSEIEARVFITGLSKTEYFIKTLLKQRIEIKVGKFQSDRLGVEFAKLNKKIASISTSEDNLLIVLNELKALLHQLQPLMISKNNIQMKIKEDVSEDAFTDVEIY